MKVDDNGQDLLMEKVAQLYAGTSIWKVNIERCREQDKNARIMDKETFDRLKDTIAEDKRLESLPYGYIKANPAGNEEFYIISGHHRLRAARSANVTEVFVLVDETLLTEDAIKSKQLAHNALAGEDDPQVLKEIFESIIDLDQKVRAGVRANNLDGTKLRSVSTDDIKIEFDYKCIKIMFLNSQATKFERVINEVEETDKVYLADNEGFDKFTATIREISKREDIRAIGSILDRMCTIVSEYYDSIPADEQADKKRPRGKE